MKPILFVLAGFAILWGCDKSTPVAPKVEFKPVCDSTLSLVWQQSVYPDSSIGEASFFNLDGSLVYGIKSYDDDKEIPPEAGFFSFENERIKYLSKLNGDEGKGFYLFQNQASQIATYNGLLAYTDGRRLYGVDQQSRIIWKNEYPDGSAYGRGGPRISNFNELVLFPSYGEVSKSDNLLLGVDIHTGKQRILYREPYKKDIRAGIYTPAVYKKGSDTIATFQISKFNRVNGHSRTDLVSWNITKNEPLWRIDSLDRYGDGSSTPPIYENGRIYCAQSYDIYCLDAETGKIIWRQGFEHFYYALIANSLLNTDHNLIVKSLGHEMALLDKNTGKIVWENRDVGATCNQMVYYKGDVIFTSIGSGFIECVDSYSGLIKWKADSPNSCRDNRTNYGLNHFVIDPKVNLLYICDNFFVQCFRLSGYD